MLKNKFRISLTLIVFTMMNLNANDNKYTMKQIYDEMCIECHRSDGSGNTDKLTPSLKDSTLQEMITSLKDVEKNKDSFDHIIMEHNRDKIIEKGMQYSAKEMSEYMFNRFHK